MEERTIIQNIFGTVNGHVVGGNMTDAGMPAAPIQQLPTKEQLCACIKAAKRHKLKAVLGTYLNVPSLLLLPLLAYMGYRLFQMLQSFNRDIQNLYVVQPVNVVELFIMGAVMLTLAWWQQRVRRRHSRTIQYAQAQIDQAEIALQFHHR